MVVDLLDKIFDEIKPCIFIGVPFVILPILVGIGSTMEKYVGLIYLRELYKKGQLERKPTWKNCEEFLEYFALFDKYTIHM